MVGEVPEGFFDGVSGASGRSGGSYARAGRYIIRIENVKALPGSERKGKSKTDATVIEGTVLAVLTPADAVLKDLVKNEPIPLHVVGEKIAEFVDMSQYHAYGHVKEFAACCLRAKVPDIKIDDITPDRVTKIAGPGQPLKGTVIEINGTPTLNQSKTFCYNRVEWIRPVPAADLAKLLTPDGVKVFGGQEALDALVATEAAAQ